MSTPASEPRFVPIHDRVQQLLARAYGEIFGCSIATAQTRLRQADAALYAAWRDIDRIEQVDWRPGAGSGGSLERSYGLAHANSEFASRLIASPSLFDHEALSIAKYCLGQQAIFAPDEDDRYALYEGVLRRGLRWIDSGKVRRRGLGPAEILQAVYHHRRSQVASRAALALLLQRRRGVLIDEAALIYFHARTDLEETEQGPRIDALRQQYADALARDWLDASLRLRLLPSSPIALACSPFWFDGKTIRNSFGKDIERMVTEVFSGRSCASEVAVLEQVKHNAGLSRHLLGQPEHPITRGNWLGVIRAIGGSALQRKPYPLREGAIEIDGWHLTRDEVYALFESAVHEVGMDASYPAGTPHCEIASVLRQWGPAHGVAPDSLNNPAALMAAFNRLQAAWLAQPRSPVSPKLLAAVNLARRNNIFLYRTTSPQTRQQQAISQTLPPTLAVLQQAGVDVAADLAHWNSLLDRSGRSYQGALEGLAASPVTERIQLYMRLAREAETIVQTAETISYANTTTLIDRLHAYFHESLRAYAAAPAFEPRASARRILREKLAMTDEQLDTFRSILIGNRSPLNRPVWLRPVDEFMARSQLAASTMSHRDRRIVPAVEWPRERDIAFKLLARHPVVVAKSKNLLRWRKAPYDGDDIAFLAETQARNIVGLPLKTIPAPPSTSALDNWLALLDGLFGSPTLKSVAEALTSGDARQVAGLFPFVLPLFDIEEGVRKGDWQRALDGVIHFGEDALFTLAGAGVEAAMARGMARGAEAMRLARAATPAAERIGIDHLRSLREILPEFSEARLGERAVSIDSDAFDVHPDADADAAAAAAAVQTQPKTLPDRAAPGSPSQPVHSLNVEGQSVMAIPSAPGFTETDSRGEPVPAAPPIFMHPHSGHHYRLTRRYGLSGGAAGIGELELAGRRTVAGIADYWATINVAEARIAKPWPLELIRELIRENDHPQHAAFESLLVDAYTRSETARVIINHAHAQSPYHRRRCSITYDAADARQHRHEVWFLSDEDLFKEKYTSPTGTVAFQTRRMMIHEILHFFTGQNDVPAYEAHNNRGPNVGLVEKVLAETLDCDPYPPRLAYARQGRFRVGRHRDGTTHTGSRILRELNEMAIAEDRYLDSILDAGREFPAGMYAMGQPIAERATVRQGLQLVTHLMRKTGRLGEGNTKRITGLLLDSLALPSLRYKTILKNFVAHSRTFRIMAASWEIVPRHAPVKIRLIPEDTRFSRYAEHHRFPHIIALAADNIWINTRPLYYFSGLDVTRFGDERLLLNALLDLFVKTLLPDIDDIALKDFSDRGIRGVLENEIMQQVAAAVRTVAATPPRICAALTMDPDAYLTDQSAITRAAVSEDGYLYNQAGSLALDPEEDGEPARQPCAAPRERRDSLFSCLDL